MPGTAMIIESVNGLLRRIDTCLIYVNRRAIVAHNTVVVSAKAGYNARGVYQGKHPESGEDVMCLGPFPNQMPTCYTPRDAAALVAEWNAEADKRNGERVQLMSHHTWWQNELLGARKALELFRDIDPATVEQAEEAYHNRAS